MIKRNTQLTIQRLLSRSAIVSDAVKSGALKVIGGRYDLDTGVVSFL